MLYEILRIKKYFAGERKYNEFNNHCYKYYLNINSLHEVLPTKVKL